MVTLEYESPNLTAKIAGDIDHHTAMTIREQIDMSIESYSPEMLYMDFRDVTFMDSSGIGLVMGRYKLMREVGGQVEVINTSKHIKRVMSLAGLDKLAKIR